MSHIYFARGDSWSIIQKDQKYVLEYISGELAGRKKSIEISQEDAQRLANDEATIDEILIAYGAN